MYELKRLYKENVPDLEELWKAVYPEREMPLEYWMWLFRCPLPYISCGLYERDKLIAHYAAIVSFIHGHTYSSMSHPDYRHQGLYQDVANFLYTELETKYNCQYATFFSNKPIHKTHQKMGALDVYQVKEYRVPIKDIKMHQGLGFFPKEYKKGSYDEWRYKNHPLKIYMYYQSKFNYLILSTHENRIQMVGYSDLEKTIGLAAFIGYLLEKDTVSFWDRKELEYPSIMLDEWLMVKLFNLEHEKRIVNIIKNQPLWMGLHDSY